jgi:membrane-associated HD superfamily phosphohydrolase
MRLLKDKADARGPGGSPEETYRYPGPRPRSRETAIVMIADQLEATARSAPPADEAACDEVIQRTLVRIRGEGQLEDSGLTESDIELMQPALSRALHAMYHRRMTYPPADTSDRTPPRFTLVPRAFSRRRAG